MEDIPDVGEKRRKALLRNFQSIDEIRTASKEELEKIPELNHRAVESIYQFFHRERIEKNKDS